MGRQVHFEVFRRAGARGGWSLHGVVGERERALTMAQEMMAGERATGVKVVKETYDDETGDYLTLKIFEDGHNKMKVAPAQEETPQVLPCFKPDDLYSYHARQTMRRLLSDFLARNKITITELIPPNGSRGDTMTITLVPTIDGRASVPEWKRSYMRCSANQLSAE